MVVDLPHPHRGSMGQLATGGIWACAMYMALAAALTQSNHGCRIKEDLAKKNSSSTQRTFVVACLSPSDGFDCLEDP